jgi:hypothetical protein
MPKDEIMKDGWKVRSPIWEECKGDPQALYERLWERIVRLREEKQAAGGPQAWDLPDDEIMTELREIRRQIWEERNGVTRRESQESFGADEAISIPKP